MDAQIFLRGRWIPKAKNKQHKNTQMLFFFFHTMALYL
jgi:hypothetical protein